MWSFCHKIAGKTVKCHKTLLRTISEFGIKGTPEEIANGYNVHLISVIPKLVKDLQRVTFDTNIAYNNSSMFLKPTTPRELCEIAKKIKNKNSFGIDEIPTSMVKIAIGKCKNILAHIVNNSLKYGIFPYQLKIA